MAPEVTVTKVALYPRDDRRALTDTDYDRYLSAGVLMCYTDIGTLERGAAAWLIGLRDLVVLNAHNFVDRRLVPSHQVNDCFFRIKGDDYFLDLGSLQLGASIESKELHIADDAKFTKLTSQARAISGAHDTTAMTATGNPAPVCSPKTAA